MSEEIETLRRNVAACTRCDLAKSRVNAVPGFGGIETELILIGEAPGRNEDLRGEPFVGSAGKILSEALEYAGLCRSALYITNVVKCRPPNNRRPTKQEVESCRVHLEKELEIIRPKIVCVLGNTAYGSLLDGSAITKNRGKILEKNGQLYFVTVHPAAVIYNPDLRQVLKDDLKTLHDILGKIKKGIKIQADG